jgi:hypothetical protein
MQKIWKRPELVVLVRGKPEEAVLAACKLGPGQGILGPGNQFNACANLPAQECVPCQAPVGS